MEIIKEEESSIGRLYFTGEDSFYVNLVNIPRDRRLIELTDTIIDVKRIEAPERKMITKGMLEKAPEFTTTDLSLFFFNPRANDMGSILSEIEALYKSYVLKGDPTALAYLNILDGDNTFIQKYPSMSLFSIDEEMYSLSSHVSVTKSIEGLNITTASCRKTSGYSPQEFWFCGIKSFLK